MDIDSDDPAFALCIVKGLGLKGVRVEYSWGRKTLNGQLVPSHIIFKIIGSPDDHRRMFPAPVRLGGALSRVEFAYVRTDPKSKKTPDPTKHAIIPGSVIVDDEKGASLVSWIDYKRDTTPSAQELISILGGLALGSLIYAVKDYWVEGSRHEFALKFSGALAHILTEVERINPTRPTPYSGTCSRRSIPTMLRSDSSRRSARPTTTSKRRLIEFGPSATRARSSPPAREFPDARRSRNTPVRAHSPT